MKRKEKPTGRWQARNTHLRKQVVLSRIFKTYGSGRLLLSIKKEVSGTFSFTCPVTALPVSYRSRLTLCTALSTSPPGHPGLPATTCIYVVGLLPVELLLLSLDAHNHVDDYSGTLSGVRKVHISAFSSFFLFSFLFCPPKINGSNSKLSLL